MLGALIKHYSKRQNTVESSTYSSELVAMRLSVEQLLGIRYKLRMMGIAVAPTSTILSDNQSVATNMQLPSSTLKKKHNSVAFHKVREAIACRIARVGFVRSDQNPADVGTKCLGPSDMYKLCGPILYNRFELNNNKPSRKINMMRRTNLEDALRFQLTQECEGPAPRNWFSTYRIDEFDNSDSIILGLVRYDWKIIDEILPIEDEDNFDEIDLEFTIGDLYDRPIGWRHDQQQMKIKRTLKRKKQFDIIKNMTASELQEWKLNYLRTYREVTNDQYFERQHQEQLEAAETMVDIQEHHHNAQGE